MNHYWENQLLKHKKYWVSPIQKRLSKSIQRAWKIGKRIQNTLGWDSPTVFYCPPRRLPLLTKEKVQEELKRLEKENIIRPVKCLRIGVRPLLQFWRIMVKLDFVSTKLYESGKREKFTLPSVDELVGAQVYRKLDCNSGFHQIALHENSHKLTTFITPFGRYCYERLPFGISSGPEILSET